MSKAVNSKWKKTFPDTIGNQNRPATGVDDTQPFETGGFPQYIANDPVRYDLQNAAMSQSMSNDARLKEMVNARGKELDDHKVDPGAHKTGIAGNAATATKVVTTAASGASANIAEATMASDDLARIRVSGETNAGELALETANDGSEPIVARQYTGIYTTPVRTAKILDESGNTNFPGTVVAPKFTGSLNGNSATATKLQTPRTLALTGKASGSATFDGSTNVAINVTSVNADTASKATQDGAGNVITNTYLKKAGDTATGDLTAPNFVGHLKGNADTAKTLQVIEGDGSKTASTFNWIGKNGQPLWLWGNDTVANNYAYNPSNFHVAYADNATNATTATTATHANDVADATMNMTASTSINGQTVTASGVIDELSSLTDSTDLTSMSKLRSFVGSVYGVSDSDWNNVISIRHRNGAGNGRGYGMIIYSNMTNTDSIKYKKQTFINSWTEERTLLDSSNYNNYAPTKTGSGASGTWGIDITGNAAGLSGDLVFPEIGNTNVSRKITWNGSTDGADIYYQTTEIDQGNLVLNLRDNTNCYLRIAANGAFKSYFSPDGVFHGNVDNADTVDGYHASDLLNKMQGVLPKTAAEVGQFRELVVNDSHQIKLPDGGTWAYFVYTYNSWSGDDSNGEHRTRTGAGIAAGGTVLHTDGSINSNTINAFKLSGTAGAGGADGNNIIVGGFCWRIA